MCDLVYFFPVILKIKFESLLEVTTHFAGTELTMILERRFPDGD